MTILRLRAAILALLCLSAGLVSAVQYARSVESRYIHALAPQRVVLPALGEAQQQADLRLKGQGTVLQDEAFRQADLLPLYGSSEVVERSYNSGYHVNELFRTYPTGFAAFPIGAPGKTCLSILEQLATIGSALSEKRLVVLLPVDSFARALNDPFFYAGNFSRLHAYALAYSTDLSLSLKRDAARRMLEFPTTLERDALLKFGLDMLADGSPASLGLYYATLPLGKLETLVLRWQDHWEALNFLSEHPELNPDVARQSERLDWASLQALAERDAQQRASSNSFGMLDEIWALGGADLLAEKDKRSGQQFSRMIEGASPGWTDFDLLLRELAELGARPLIVSPPLKGSYFRFIGISAPARRLFYERLHDATERYQFPLVNFEDHDDDRYFGVDRWSHLSSKGWAYVSQALDSFYHGELR